VLDRLLHRPAGEKVQLNYRYLGKQRLKVSAIGYGCSTFVGQRNDVDEKQAIYVLGRKPPCG
jgi:hypothetical protein